MLGNSFLYCWTDHATNKLYVGKHKGTEDDGYICSSKPMLEEYKVRPEDFTRQIIAHGTEEDILKLETVILTTVNARVDEHFYNKTNCLGLFWKDEQRALDRIRGKRFAETEKGKKHFKAMAAKRHALKLPTRSKWSEEEKRSHSEKIKTNWKNGVYVNRAYKRNRKILSEQTKTRWTNGEFDSLKWSKPIHTPFGDFPSLTVCSQQISLNYDQIRYRLKTKSDWYYIKEPKVC